MMVPAATRRTTVHAPGHRALHCNGSGRRQSRQKGARPASPRRRRFAGPPPLFARAPQPGRPRGRRSTRFPEPE
ncbi:hypothetical protein D8I24_1637 [Cupriavidus necator H850]|nr:hypothetical protein D8I24_1637 [Cupriavidus necator H850]